MNNLDDVTPASKEIKDEFRALARVVHDALMMIASYLRRRYLS